MIDFFKVVFYQPLYNGLVFLTGVFPWEGLGLAVVSLTLIVRLILLPVSHKSTKAQAQMRVIEPEVKNQKEKYKDNREEQAKQIMELYQRHGLNPFSGCLLLLVQLPVVISLYFVFYRFSNF